MAQLRACVCARPSACVRTAACSSASSAATSCRSSPCSVGAGAVPNVARPRFSVAAARTSCCDASSTAGARGEGHGWRAQAQARVAACRRLRPADAPRLYHTCIRLLCEAEACWNASFRGRRLAKELFRSSSAFSSVLSILLVHYWVILLVLMVLKWSFRWLALSRPRGSRETAGRVSE